MGSRKEGSRSWNDFPPQPQTQKLRYLQGAESGVWREVHYSDSSICLWSLWSFWCSWWLRCLWVKFHLELSVHVKLLDRRLDLESGQGRPQTPTGGAAPRRTMRGGDGRRKSRGKERPRGGAVMRGSCKDKLKEEQISDKLKEKMRCVWNEKWRGVIKGGRWRRNTLRNTHWEKEPVGKII